MIADESTWQKQNGAFMYAEKTDYDDIEMSSWLRNVLRRNGFESLEGLREYPKEYFIKFRNMGQASLQELYQICEEQGGKAAQCRRSE